MGITDDRATFLGNHYLPGWNGGHHPLGQATAVTGPPGYFRSPMWSGLIAMAQPQAPHASLARS